MKPFKPGEIIAIRSQQGFRGLMRIDQIAGGVITLATGSTYHTDGTEIGNEDDRWGLDTSIHHVTSAIRKEIGQYVTCVTVDWNRLDAATIAAVARILEETRKKEILRFEANRSSQGKQNR